MIKAAIFDKDGTLFDFQATWGVFTGQLLTRLAAGDDAVFTSMAHDLKYDVATQTLKSGSIVIAGTPSDIANVLLPYLPDQTLRELVAEMDSIATGTPQVPVCDLGMFFQILHGRSLKLAVMTNDSEAPAKAHLGDLAKQLDMIVGSDSGYGGKPAPDPLLAIADQLNLDPGDCVMVGDSTHDLIAGRAAGMTTIAVLTGVAAHRDLEPFAHHVLPDITHLPDLLDSL